VERGAEQRQQEAQRLLVCTDSMLRQVREASHMVVWAPRGIPLDLTGRTDGMMR
jgi:hypothetical protein